MVVPPVPDVALNTFNEIIGIILDIKKLHSIIKVKRLWVVEKRREPVLSDRRGRRARRARDETQPITRDHNNIHHVFHFLPSQYHSSAYYCHHHFTITAIHHLKTLCT
jgi:hypothetical protein